jgi:hypothetical protein
MVGDCGLVSISRPYPNPVTVDGIVKVNLQSMCPKNVKWAVYSAAYRKIGEWSLTVNGSTKAMWNLTDAKGKPIAAGIYYMVFTPDGQNRQTMPVAVLR